MSFLKKNAVPLLLGLALVLRLAWAWQGHREGKIHTGSDGYEPIALSLLERGEYAEEKGKPTAIREPVYPLVIAALYYPSGRRPWLVLVLHALLGTATCLLAWRLGTRLFGARAGLWALAVCAVHPQLVYYTAYFFRDTLLAWLFMLLAVASMDWSSSPNHTDGDYSAIIGGCAGAALGLANSAHLPLVGLAGLALWAVAPTKAAARRTAFFFLPVLLAFGLWSWRNYRVFKAFVPGSTHGGPEFYQALVVPPADLGTERQTEILAKDATFQAAAKLGEYGQSKVLTKAGFDWIVAHPGTYAGRALAGFVKFWRPWPYARAYTHSYKALLAASLASDAWIVPLGLLGLWLFRGRWREASAVWVGAFALTAVYGAVHAVIRYRLPLMPAMIVFAVAAILRLRGNDPETRPGYTQ